MPDAVSYLLTPPYFPFTVALAVMLGLLVLELVGLGLSQLLEAFDLDFDLDHGPDHAVPGDGQLLSWLGVGVVPIGMLLVTLLTTFGLCGVALQRGLYVLGGAPFSAGLAAAVVALPALLLNGFAARALAAVLPADETTAVSVQTFLAKRAVLLDAPAQPGLPARATLRDVHGQQHYVAVLPESPYTELLPGEEVLLVRKEGELFYALPPERMHL